MTFCYWQIRNNLDEGVGGFLASCSLLITILTCYNLLNYYLIRNQIQLQRSAKIIFLYLPLWGITHIGKLVFGLVVYKQQFSNNDLSLPVDADASTQIRYSKIFCVVDSLSTVILHGLLLLVPYIWICNIVGCVVNPENYQQNLSNRQSRINLSISFYSTLIRVLKFYMFARYAVYIGLFTTQLALQDNGGQISQLLCSIINFVIIFESFVCMCLFFVCLNVLINNLEYIRIQSYKQKAEMLKQFVFVSFFCLIRFFINLFFLELGDVNCTFNQIHKQQLKHTIIYLGGGIIATHFIPILLIYRIFKLNLKQIQKERSSIMEKQRQISREVQKNIANPTYMNIKETFVQEYSDEEFQKNLNKSVKSQGKKSIF